jgi:hypothetical protein
MPAVPPYSFNVDFCEESGTLVLQCATQADIDAYMWPKGALNVILAGDQVNHLVLPEGVETVYCNNQGLCSLTLPDSCIIVRAENNRLTELELPAGVQWVTAQNNKIVELRFRGGAQPTALSQLDLENNRLARVDFVPPPMLDEIKLRGNSFLSYVSPQLMRVINTHLECTI